jgi:hypothetical protein
LRIIEGITIALAEESRSNNSPSAFLGRRRAWDVHIFGITLRSWRRVNPIVDGKAPGLDFDFQAGLPLHPGGFPTGLK